MFDISKRTIIKAAVCAGFAVAAALSNSFQINTQAASNPFTILEFIPEYGTGEIGYYIEGEEPIQSFTSIAEYEEFIAAATAKGIYSEDSDTPLSPQKTILPWEAPSSALMIDTGVDQEYALNGSFEFVTGGAYTFGTDGKRYVGPGNGIANFIIDPAGDPHTILNSFKAITTGYTNNNWFEEYVMQGYYIENERFDDIEVISIRPSDIASETELKDLLDKTDLLIFTKGFDLFDDYKSPPLYTYYNDNDFETSSYTDIIKDYVLGYEGKLDNNLPFAYNMILNTNESHIGRFIDDVMGSKATWSPYVDNTIFGVTDGTTALPILSDGFYSPFDSWMYNSSWSAFYEVYNDILLENELIEKESRDNPEFLKYYRDDTRVSMAYVFRYIIELNLRPRPSILYLTGENGTAPLTHVHVPTTYRGEATTDTIIRKNSGKELTFSLYDDNVGRIELEVSYYYKDNDGGFYYNDEEETIETYDPLNSDHRGKMRFSKVDIPNSVQNDIDDFNNDVIDEELFSHQLLDEFIEELTNTDIYSLPLVLEANVKVGYRHFTSYSDIAYLQKLPLLLLG